MSDQIRVIAYTMHETEQAEARQRLTEVTATDAFVIGQGDRATIDELRRHGIVVRELEPVTSTPSQPPTQPPTLSAETGGAAPPRAGSFVVVKLREPLCDVRRREIETAGLDLRDRLGHVSFTAHVRDPAGVDLVRNLPFVAAVSDFDSPVRRARGPAAAQPARPVPPVLGAAWPEPLITYDVLLHDANRLGEVEDFAKQKGIQIVGKSARKCRVLATDSQAEELNELDAVRQVEQYVPPKLCNDRARAIVFDRSPSPLGLTGSGEIIGVADSGIDATHPAFAASMAQVIARGRPGDASDPHGHGTHVAGTIAGSSAAQQGIASGARLVFQSIMDGSGGLTGLPIDLNDLFEEAYGAGARIHNDSWGADLASTYTVSSLEVDDFVHRRRDMLVVIAAGNAGTCVSQGIRHTQVGFVEWGSIGAPATSKNALVVGASRSDRSDGGFAQLTYGDVWGNAFPDAPIAKQSVSGDPECLAGFSARGPCNDMRIKPDVVAPGTDVLSACAGTAPPANFAEVIQIGGAKFGFMSGTSMAAPVVAGVAALVREWLRVQRNCPEPSAALLKALLINGTRRLSGADSIADHPDLPNFHQGFGAVSLGSTLPLDGSFVLAFVDNWKLSAEFLTMSGMRRRYRFRTTAVADLRITLAYTDAPGRGIQNDVSMIVEMPDKTKRLGNETVPLKVFEPDPNNNVEILRIANAPQGDYMIQVTATTLLHPPQDFALVVSGALAANALTPL